MPRSASTSPTSARSAPEVTAVVDALTAMVDGAFHVVDEIAGLVRQQLAPPSAPTRSRLVGVDALAGSFVGDPSHPVRGAGFVAAVGFLTDQPWWLEWFAQGEDGRSHRMVSQTDPDGAGFYDYEFLPWYLVPRDTRRRHITGPYIDYVCTDDYNMTYTAPVLIDDRFAGVAGADIGVQTAETILMPALRAATQPLAVVNQQGRIVASNSGRHLCGDLVTGIEVSELWTHPASGGLHVLPDLPLGVLELRSSSTA